MTAIYLFFSVFETSEGVCDDGWLKFQDHCYLVSDHISTWHNAQTYCVGKNANLAVIETDAEHGKILEWINLYTSKL